jgi:O-antigen ligase
MIRGHGVVRQLPACLHFIFCAAFTVGFVLDRASPVDASVLMAVALPLLWVVFQPTVSIRDDVIGWFTVLGIVWLLWMCLVQGVLAPAYRCGWWRFAEYAAALSTCLFVALQRVGSAHSLRLLGVAVTCSLGVALVVNWDCDLLSPFQTFCFGFGHINILMCTAGPSLMAWCVYLAVSMKEGDRPRPRDLIIAACGIVFITALAITTGRRGVIFASAAVAAWFALVWVTKRSKPLAIGLVLLMAASFAIYQAHLFTQDLSIGRNERILIYKSGWDAVRQGFPWGLGFYGTLQVQHAAGEAARHITAGGSKGTHIHNEFLDKLIDGGPIGLLLVLALLALIAYRIWNIRERPVRYAFQALAIAIAVHMMTDNSYGSTTGLMWGAVIAGMMLAAPSVSPIWPIRILPGARLIMWPLSLISVWGVTREIYPAVLHKDATVEVRLLCMRRALEPQTVDLHVVEMCFDDSMNVNMATKKTVVDLGVEKLGWSGMLAVAQGRWAMELGSPRQQVEAMLRILGFTAFDKPTYAQLAILLEQHPDCVGLVPPVVQRRLAYMQGRPGLASPNLDQPIDSIDLAADCYAALIWKIAVGRPWAEIKPPLYRLLEKYGDVPGVTQLMLEATRLAPPGTFADVPKYADILLWGTRYPGMDQPIRDASTVPAEAEALAPLMMRMYPEIFRQFETGTMPMVDNASFIQLRNALARIWGHACRHQTRQ